jgi:hypothetical protein
MATVVGGGLMAAVFGDGLMIQVIVTVGCGG